MTKEKADLLEKIKESDMVLVGLGVELSPERAKMEQAGEYKEALAFVSNTPELLWLTPFIDQIYRRKYMDERVKGAYQNLKAILEGKNYFLVSVCTDDLIYDVMRNQERITTPCGGYRMLQCKKRCSDFVIPAHDMFERVKQGLLDRETLHQIKRPCCSQCGSELVFNQIHNDPYTEEGYLKQWHQYKKWLQSTVNRKLCIVELGVSLEYPTVIRWPFEKIAYYNQKSAFYRIHSRLFQLTEELKDRGISIPEHAVDFLLN